MSNNLNSDLNGGEENETRGRRVQIYNEDMDKPKVKKERPLTAEEKALKTKIA